LVPHMIPGRTIRFQASALRLNNQQLNAITAVVNPIRDLFLKHKVHKHLGIALLHKHFPIRPTERLVDCRSISAPWDIGDDTNADTRKYESLILPRSFRLVKEKFVPYEFDFSDADLPRQVDHAFLSELSSSVSAQIGSSLGS
ncbi:MAG: hypothetical protein M1839_006518, partial [Geoglossum umbratile]